MLFNADVFAAVAVVVANDRSTYELRAGEDGNKERGALLSFISSRFLFYFVDVLVLRDRVRMRRNDWELKITALKERQKHFQTKPMNIKNTTLFLFREFHLRV